MSADAYHITQPAEEGEGGWRVMTTAIHDAKLGPIRHRLRECPRNFDADWRRAGNHGH